MTLREEVRRPAGLLSITKLGDKLVIDRQMLTVLSILTGSLMVSAYPTDVPRDITDSLKAVTIVADKGVVVSKRDYVSIRQDDEIPSLVNRIPGLSLSDYGSLAGLKSVSLRGMGSANTSVYIDGVKVSNVQSGQPDLGFISQNSFSSMVVDYAQNSLSFISAQPQFKGTKRYNATVSLYGGSFSTWQPHAGFEYKINDKLSAKADFSFQHSKGNFPYSDLSGKSAYRINNDIDKFNSGIDLFGQLSNGSWHTKAYYSDNNRGTPGSFSFPDADSRQKDRNAFIQFRMNNKFRPFYELHISSKAALDNLDYKYSYADYLYRQKEIQLNSSHIFTIKNWWKASAAVDLHYADLHSKENGADYYNASRTSIQTAISSYFEFENLSSDIALLYNAYIDKGYNAKNCFSTSFNIQYQFTKELKASAFTRRAYRVPTFNDLYYPGMSSTNLKPEDSWMNDISLEYGKPWNQKYEFKASASVFYYALSNKITTMPDPNDSTGWTWLPYNIGTVHNTGTEVSLSFEKYQGDLKYKVQGSYSFQNAIDKSNDSQVPYVAKNTLSTILSMDYRNWTLSLNHYLKAGRNDTQGEMPSYNIFDIRLSKQIASMFTIMLRADNVFDERFEVVRDYPMPGRSVTGGIEIRF